MEVFGQIIKNATDFKHTFSNIHAYMISVILQQFISAGRGGDARGVFWPYFTRQYIRKDGTVVPAWGGVPRHIFANQSMGLGNWLNTAVTTAKARKTAKGLVLGRLRGYERKRVTSTSQLMRSTGMMFSALLQKVTMSRTKLTMNTADKLGKVARQNDLRPFEFFEEPEDVNMIEDFFLSGLAKDIPEDSRN